MLRIKFVLNGDQSDPAGKGVYVLYSSTFPEREICCDSTTQERRVFDILRQNYEGLIALHVLWFVLFVV